MANPEALQLLAEIHERTQALLMDRRGFTYELIEAIHQMDRVAAAALNPRTAIGVGLHD